MRFQQRSFGWLWTASTLSALGDGLAAAALPLLMLQTTTDPVLIASLQAATGLPWLLFGLHSGVLADRYDRRLILWGADLLRLIITALLVALVVLDAAPVPVVLVLAFVYSVGTIAYRSAAPAIIPSMVNDDEIVDANGRLQFGTTAAGMFIGPGAGGLLFALFSWVPFSAQAIALLGSVICLRRLPASQEPKSAEKLPVRTQIAEGLALVARDRILLVLASGTMLLAASTGMVLAVLALFTVVTLGAPESAFGFVFTVYAIGSMLTAPFVSRMHRKIGGRACLIISGLGGVTSLAIIPASGTLITLAVGMFLLGSATIIYNVLAVTIRQRRTPDELLGRVSSVYNLLGVGSAPLAALAAGWIADVFSVSAAIYVASGLCVAATLMFLVALPGRESVDACQPSPEPVTDAAR